MGSYLRNKIVYLKGKGCPNVGKGPQSKDIIILSVEVMLTRYHLPIVKRGNGFS